MQEILNTSNLAVLKFGNKKLHFHGFVADTREKLINHLIIRYDIHQRNHQQDTLNIQESNSILLTPVPNRRKSYLNIKDKVKFLLDL